MTTFDSTVLLTEGELRQSRSPDELVAWVDEKCRLFPQHKDGKEWVLLHQGLSKVFHEEIFPFSRWFGRLYAARSDVTCLFTLDNRDHDAVVRDYSASPPCETKVEITSAAIDYDEHLRMKYFVEHGHVNAWGGVSSSGTKRKGYTIDVENEAFKHSDLLQRAFGKIKKAAEGKGERPGEVPRYGKGYVLLIAFDDWQWFSSVMRDVVVSVDLRSLGLSRHRSESDPLSGRHGVRVVGGAGRDQSSVGAAGRGRAGRGAEVNRDRCRRAQVGVAGLRMGNRRQRIAAVRARPAVDLVTRPMLSLAETARQAGVSTSVLAKAASGGQQPLVHWVNNNGGPCTCVTLHIQPHATGEWPECCRTLLTEATARTLVAEAHRDAPLASRLPSAQGCA